MQDVIVVGYRLRPLTEPPPTEWQQPFLATIDKVFMVGLRTHQVGSWAYREPDSDKPPVYRAVYNWCVRHYGRDAWPLFVGFDIERFIDVFTAECSLTEGDCLLPLSPLEQGGRLRFADVGRLLSHGCRGLSLRELALLRRPSLDTDQQLWDKKMQSWDGPGAEPELDTWLATQLILQHGLVRPALPDDQTSA